VSLCSKSDRILEHKLTFVSVVETFGEAGKAHKRFADAADEFNDSFADWMGPLVRVKAVTSIFIETPLLLPAHLARRLLVRPQWLGGAHRHAGFDAGRRDHPRRGADRRILHPHPQAGPRPRRARYSVRQTAAFKYWG
jgi:hypothetical protein